MKVGKNSLNTAKLAAESSNLDAPERSNEKLINLLHCSKLKKCRFCQKELSPSEFHLNKSKRDGLDSRCKRCVSQGKAKLYKKKERMRKVSTLFESSIVGELDSESIDEFGQSFALCIEEMIDAGKL